MDEEPVRDDDKLNARQLLGMQRLDDTIRAGFLARDGDEAAQIELLIRLGRVSSALKRVTAARRTPR